MQRRDFLKRTLVSGITGAGVIGGIAGAEVNGGELGSEAVAMTKSARVDLRIRGASIIPVDLRCESRSNPLGIDSEQPRLSWKLKSVGNARNLFQSAYRIQVATSFELLAENTPDLWDSGLTESNDQLNITYLGRPLRSGERCYWKVEVWDQEGQKSTESAVSWWEMGLLNPADWTGKWIEDGKTLPENEVGFYDEDPSPLFRKKFWVDKSIKQARLYVTALGYFDVRFNGKSVSDNVLEPAWTHTEKRVYYSTHDLTKQLVEGENVLGVELGNGWRNPLPLRMWGRINIREHLPVGRPQFLAEMIVHFEDGSSERISSDESWMMSQGPRQRNSVYLGEVYDARREQEGWDRSGFDDAGWAPVITRKWGRDWAPGFRLQALPIPPIRITRALSADSLNEVQPGVFVFDFGQNFAGWARLKVRGESGTEVKMRLGELIYQDGTLNPMTAVTGQIKGLRQDGSPQGGPGAPEIAWQSNTYILRGGEEEEYTPKFTFHGFRYVEVTGFPGKPDLHSVEGLRLNTDVESVGTFACSNERFNQIQDLIPWTFLSNLFSVQSDCPAREKFQYGGDIVASSEMAIFNYDMATFYAKAVSDFSDAARDGWFTETAPFVGIAAGNYVKGAGPIGWGLAHPLLLAQLYQYYGDRRIVEEHFEAARTWVDLLEASSEGYIIDRCIGDHESLDPKPIELVATAQFYQAALMITRFSEILGKTEDQKHYQDLADAIRRAFVDRFIEHGTGRVGIATQAAQSTALYSGLVPDADLNSAISRMVESVTVDHNGHIAAGIFGTKYLLNMLSETGHADVAYQMVDQKTYPGWGHMIENGATTLWETWAQSDNVFSQNHPMFGSVSEWFFKSLGGIAPAPNAFGFDRFSLAPFFSDDMEWLDVSYASVRGNISCSWRRTNGQIEMNISVPINTTAVVRLPTSDVSSVQEGGRPTAEAPELRLVSQGSADEVHFEVGSGRYQFTIMV